jgi:hypothetical protein
MDEIVRLPTPFANRANDWVLRIEPSLERADAMPALAQADRGLPP